MRWRTTVVSTWLACGALAAPALAVVPTQEAEILRQVAAAYGSLTNFIFEGDLHMVIERPSEPQIQDLPFRVAAGTGGRVRDEMTSPTMGGLIVSDGRETIVYNAALGQYTRSPGGADSTAARMPNRGVGSAIMGRYRTIAEAATTARRLPDTTLTLAGVAHPCVVLEVDYPSTTGRPEIQELPRTYWIDQETHLVLRQRTVVRIDSPRDGGVVEQREEIAFRRAERDPVLPDSIWAFRPPAGSREVSQFEMPGQGMDPARLFTGRPAIDFTLKDLAGRPHSLKTLRGKVVLLDFWATWCGPCRITMPHVAKIHAEYKNRGVAVMSINVGETVAKAQAYIKKNGFLFTTLLDQDRVVSTRYQVNGIPTLVVIDRKGNVSDYLVGVHDGVALRAALAKAGVR